MDTMPDYKNCKNIEVHLTPPALIDKLCKGEHLPSICRDAIFTEEFIEIAKGLGRARLVTLEICNM
jgi:hypothetical protein